jgi:cellulose biosynthesis protein BcsQ
VSHVFTLFDAKGGYGKSTVALNVVICCPRASYQTLIVDFDQRGNLAAVLWFRPDPSNGHPQERGFFPGSGFEEANC